MTPHVPELGAKWTGLPEGKLWLGVEGFGLRSARQEQLNID
jgi:hypothetical protein